MKEKQKKHITDNPQPKTAVASPTKASRKRQALEVAAPVEAASVLVTTPSTPSGATASAGATPYRPGTGLAGMAASSVPVLASSTPTTGTPGSTATTATTVVGADAPPPNALVPTVPSGYGAPPKSLLNGWRLTQAERATMANALVDLSALEGSYKATLGASCPDPSAIAAKANLGLQWRAMRDESVAWADYTVTVDAFVWKGVLVALDKLKVLFETARVLNPELATTYPGLTALFNAQKVPAVAAAATKKRKAKAAKAAAGTPATTAAPSAPADPSPAKVTINT